MEKLFKIVLKEVHADLEESGCSHLGLPLMELKKRISSKQYEEFDYSESPPADLFGSQNYEMTPYSTAKVPPLQKIESNSSN